jgi:thioredoxin-related protein
MRNPRLHALLRCAVLATALSAAAQAAAQAPQPGQFLGAMQTVYPDWFKPSFLEFSEEIAEAAAAGRRYMLFIHQDGCPYCSAMVEKNLAEPDIERLMRKHLDVVELNMWGDRRVVSVGGQAFTEKEFAQALKVQFTPTLIFFDEQGEVILRLNGYLPPAQFRVALDYVVGHHEKRQRYRDYVAARSAAPPAGTLHHEPFFDPPPHDLQGAGDLRPLAVFFEQRGCATCDELHAKLLSEPAIRAQATRFRAVQFDMWADTPLVTPGGERTTARDWAAALGVAYAPTVVLFDPDGREVIRSEAWFRSFHTESLFAYVAEGAHRAEPSFQRYISARAERLIEHGQDVNIWR